MRKLIYNIVIILIIVFALITLFSIKRSVDESNKKLDSVVNVINDWELDE